MSSRFSILLQLLLNFARDDAVLVTYTTTLYMKHDYCLTIKLLSTGDLSKISTAIRHLDASGAFETNQVVGKRCFSSTDIERLIVCEIAPDYGSICYRALVYRFPDEVYCIGLFINITYCVSGR